jgi:hypothetical protein
MYGTLNNVTGQRIDFQLGAHIEVSSTKKSPKYMQHKIGISVKRFAHKLHAAHWFPIESAITTYDLRSKHISFYARRWSAPPCRHSSDNYRQVRPIDSLPPQLILDTHPRCLLYFTHHSPNETHDHTRVGIGRADGGAAARRAAASPQHGESGAD